MDVEGQIERWEGWRVVQEGLGWMWKGIMKGQVWKWRGNDGWKYGRRWRNVGQGGNVGQ